MKVTLTEKYDLKIYDLPFELRFEFSKKRGVDGAHWFTPSGKCKIWVGGCNINHLGKLGSGQYDKLMAMMKKGKNDVLTDGKDLFTTGNDNIMQIDNLENILNGASEEWEARKDSFETYRNF